MPDSVEIDLAGVTTRMELHHLLAVKLGFPDYYGRNWDAFDECISDPDLELPTNVRFVGTQSLAKVLPREAELLRECTVGLADSRLSFEWHP